MGPRKKKKSASKSPKKPTMDLTYQRHLLKQMIRIRQMEDKAYELYTQEKIRGFLHLYDGEEAIAVGVIEQLEEEDSVVGTYREHGHALIKGVSMKSIIAELYGKSEGCSGGRGGSMHLYDKDTQFLGGSAIVANGLPMAVGVGLSYKKQQKDSIAVCFFGEGAVDEGEFHEAMNLAALWEVPVLFVCENNLYSMGMPFELAEAETDLVYKAASYKVEGNSVDGMDLLTVMDAAHHAITYVRKHSKPYFLECKTYRYRAHSMFDPERYRTKEEIKEWQQRDPIERFADMLEDDDGLSEDQRQEMESEVATEVEEAVKFAEAGSEEPVEQLNQFVYSE